MMEALRRDCSGEGVKSLLWGEIDLSGLFGFSAGSNLISLVYSVYGVEASKAEPWVHRPLLLCPSRL